MWVNLFKKQLIELENKIPDISSLATKTALTAVENKIPSVSSLFKKTDNDTKITEIETKLTDHNHDKYITTHWSCWCFECKISISQFDKKTDFDAKLSSLPRKITANKSKNLLVDKELKKWKTFDSSYFIGKSHFEGDGTSATEQIFQSDYQYWLCFIMEI